MVSEPWKHGHYGNPYRSDGNGWEVSFRKLTIWVNDDEMEWDLTDLTEWELGQIGERLIAAGQCVKSLTNQAQKKWDERRKKLATTEEGPAS